MSSATRSQENSRAIHALPRAPISQSSADDNDICQHRLSVEIRLSCVDTRCTAACSLPCRITTQRASKASRSRRIRTGATQHWCDRRAQRNVIAADQFRELVGVGDAPQKSQQRNVVLVREVVAPKAQVLEVAIERRSRIATRPAVQHSRCCTRTTKRIVSDRVGRVESRWTHVDDPCVQTTNFVATVGRRNPATRSRLTVAARSMWRSDFFGKPPRHEEWPPPLRSHRAGQ